ncbi:MAG: YkgJ family cysteine cluster protein [Lachnospiraceae bacterium]
MKLYEINDMVKVGCHDCAGCSSCCQGMGDTIILDPLDIYRLTCGLHKSFEELLEDCVELHVEEGVILPNLKMTGEKEQCFFLNREGRCAIHALRPGLCRTFPLGRNYEEGKLTYFLLEEECPRENKTKVKVGKWIDTPRLSQNQAFLVKWHYLIKALREKTADFNAEELKNRNLLLLHVFFLRSYAEDADFYSQFEERLAEFMSTCPELAQEA